MELGDHQGGPLRKPLWAKEDTDNPTGSPKASPRLQGGGVLDKAGLGYNEETWQLLRMVREFSRYRTGVGLWVERSEGKKAQSILWERRSMKDQWGFYLGWWQRKEE